MTPRDAPSLARSFYQRFIDETDRVAFLKELVASSVFETEWLEFKSYPHTAPGQPDDKIKEFWSKNISAFANTQGGVLVWGIDAHKIDGVDAAHALRLVPSPQLLRSRLYELHHLATDPPVDGIDIQAVEDLGESGQGFVVCFIPQGQFVPYRAEFNIKNYYIRIGDDSIIAPPVILRRLFFPQSQAKLEMRVVLASERKEREWK